MKRLIKRAFGKKLYHGTSVESFFSILESGAIYPQEKQASDWAKPENIDRYFNGDKELYDKNMSNYEGFTFFATDYYTAKEYGYRARGKSNVRDVYVVIEADVSEDALMPDLNDAPNAKTWQDSAREVGEVCVLGAVTTDYITGVSFIFTDIHIEVNSSLNNWQEDVKAELKKEVKRSGRYFGPDEYYDMLDQLKISHNYIRD